MSEPNYHTTKFFTEKLLSIDMSTRQILMNKPVSLGLWTLELSKIIMHEFWCNYVKPKYGEKGKLCNMDTDFVCRLLFAYILCMHENRWYL